MKPTQKYQGGFTLIETSIAMIIFMMCFISITQFGLAMLKKDAGERAGTKIAQYNAAVAAHINANQPNVPLRAWGGPLPNVSDIRWLQDAATCPGGQANAAFLPCGFDAWLPYGLVMGYTRIQQNGQAIQAVTTFGVPHAGMNGPNPVPDRVAAGHVINGAEAFKGIYASTVERDVGYLGYAIDPATGTITASVDTGVQAVPWLNRNGTNSMTGNLNMGGNNVTNANTVTGNNLQANNNVTATNNVAAGQDMSAGRDVSANAAGAGGDVSIQGSGYVNPVTGTTEPISLAGSSFGQTYVDNLNNTVEKPKCPPGKIAQIYMVPGQWSVGGLSEPVGAVDLKYVDFPSYWQVYIILTTPSYPNGYAPPAGTATALVNFSCQ